jgi:hypothetical protein
MRDRSSWQKPLLAKLSKVWPWGLDIDAPRLCDVELALTLLERIAPNEPANSAWALLTGYPHGPTDAPCWTDDQARAIGVARHLLLHLKNRHDWHSALHDYMSVPADLRGFDTPAGGEAPATRRTAAVALGRWEIYAATLDHTPRLQRDTLTTAAAGTYLFPARGVPQSVKIPDDVPLPGVPVVHDVTGCAAREPFIATRDDLLETASWMDTVLDACQHFEDFGGRLGRLRLEMLGGNLTTDSRPDTLHVDGLLHLGGMVSSGKSTLMDVVAVHAARCKRLRVTLVVGDVTSAARRASLFRTLGIRSAPIVGVTNFKRHIERLHRLEASERSLSLLAHADPGFDFLNTACMLDGLRDVGRPIPFEDAPCRRLVPAVAPDDGDDDEDADERRRPNIASRKQYGCPLYAACQRHRGARDLVGAQILVATPASLVYSRVPTELARERLRYLELIYRASDLVIVDEADQVQVQLDAMFSPGQTLVGRQGNSWLDEVLALKDEALSRGGRRQFAETSVAAWNTVADAARAAANRLYALVRQAPRVQRWIEQNYFTAWTLSDELIREWVGVARNEDAREHAAYQQLRRAFNSYLDDPLGDRGDGGEDPLAALTRAALPSANVNTLRLQLRRWLDEQELVTLPGDRRNEAVLKLEFVLLLAVLAERLNILIRRWKQVEVPLDLEGSSPMLFHRPPEDFAPTLPESPMGNVLGFQYRPDPDDPEQMGELRFFRCAGVGRWILLHLHDLFAADAIAGPNVILLSGTSWAGTSPSYHIQTPVGGVLHAPSEEVDAITRSTFVFLPLLDNNQQPLTVSGQRAGRRINALHEMLLQLARRGRIPGAPSRLEVERDRLPDGRRRILLLVGSYSEAKQAHSSLLQIRDDWRGQVRYLVADNDSFEVGWEDGGALRRGEVDKLAQSGAWLLIAPLQAIERGHNILNDERKAALGAAYFLVRPHPRPDDIGAAIHAINHWAVDRIGQLQSGGTGVSLDERGRAFHAAAYAQWRRFLRLPMVYSTLPPADRDALTWSELVSIWQVIGRLVRGGCEARVFFCDAAFARLTATGAEGGDTGSSSLLVNMRRVLRPYFESADGVPCGDRELVNLLYRPFYDALARIQGVAEHA